MPESTLCRVVGCLGRRSEKVNGVGLCFQHALEAKSGVALRVQSDPEDLVDMLVQMKEGLGIWTGMVGFVTRASKDMVTVQFSCPDPELGRHRMVSVDAKLEAIMPLLRPPLKIDFTNVEIETQGITCPQCSGVMTKSRDGTYYACGTPGCESIKEVS